MSATGETRVRTGLWIPWLFVAGFAVIFTANGIMIAFAINSWTGLGTEAPYEKGIRYNDNLAAAKRQNRLGWQHQMDVEALAPQSARLVLRLADADRQPVFADAIVAKLVRPTHEGWDFETELIGRGDGRYRADVEFPLAGQWEVRIVARRGADLYQAHQRVLIK